MRVVCNLLGHKPDGCTSPMIIIGIVLLLTVFCTTSGCISASSKDPIVGSWIGKQTDSSITFYKNETYVAVFNYTDGNINNSSIFTGNWTREDNSSRYSLHSNSSRVSPIEENLTRIIIDGKIRYSVNGTVIPEGTEVEFGTIYLENQILHINDTKYTVDYEIIKDNQLIVGTKVIEMVDNFERIAPK